MATRRSNRNRDDSVVKAAWIQAGAVVASAVLGALVSWNLAKEKVYDAFSVVENEVHNEYSGENMTVINQYGDSYEYEVNTDSFEAFLDSVTDNYKNLITENARLSEQNDQLDEQNNLLAERNNQLQEQIESLQSLREAAQNQNQEEVQSGQNAENTVLALKPHDMKNSASYKGYEGYESFQMFGREYNDGFTISMGASYNMWGNGVQYAIFNVEEISREYASIQLLVGHVDGYDVGDITLEIYVDKNLEQEPDITHVIKAEEAPAEIGIDLNGAKSLIIKVSNQGGSTNMAGFGEIEFVKS